MNFATLRLFVWIPLAQLVFVPALAEDSQREYTNLQVLPADITRDELRDVMLANLRGLGLPRRQNRGCLHCHEGDMEQPVDSWDFASDAKPTKLKARQMLAMVAAINDEFLDKLEDRLEPTLSVNCYTCHAGRLDPRPLSDVVMAEYADHGVDGVISKYRSLRERYFASDAYDFRVGTLPGMARHLASEGNFDDALALEMVNVEVFPGNHDAQQSLLMLRLWRVVEEQGASFVVHEFEQMKNGEFAAALSYSLLDSIGWGLDRSDRHEDALLMFRMNREEFPDEYIPLESLADANWSGGEQLTAIRLYEEWLNRNPEHEMARQRLLNLRDRLEESPD